MREAGKGFDVRNRTRRNVQQNEKWSFAEQKAPGLSFASIAVRRKRAAIVAVFDFYFRDELTQGSCCQRQVGLFDCIGFCVSSIATSLNRFSSHALRVSVFSFS